MSAPVSDAVANAIQRLIDEESDQVTEASSEAVVPVVQLPSPEPAPAAPPPPATEAPPERTAGMAAVTVNDLFATAETNSNKTTLRSQAKDFAPEWDKLKTDAEKRAVAIELRSKMGHLEKYLPADIAAEITALVGDAGTSVPPSSPPATPVPAEAGTPAAPTVVQRIHENQDKTVFAEELSDQQVRVTGPKGIRVIPADEWRDPVKRAFVLLEIGEKSSRNRLTRSSAGN